MTNDDRIFDTVTRAHLDMLPPPNSREYRALIRQHMTVPGQQITWPTWTLVALIIIVAFAW